MRRDIKFIVKGMIIIMKNGLKKMISLAAAGSMLICSACSNNGGDTGTGEKVGDSYPLNSKEKLTVWTTLPLNPNYSSPEQQPEFKAMIDQIGVDLEFKVGQSTEQFNLMLASGEMCDIIITNWAGLPGGPQKYIDNNTIVPLNDLIDKYSPNLKKYLESRPDIDKMIKTDNGDYYVYPNIKDDDELCVFYGPALRKDLLDKCGLDIPETIDEWHTALKKFKDEGVKSPLSLYGDGLNAFSAAYDVINDYYIDDSGKVVFGPAQKGWKDFLTTMKSWYDEGLIDKDLGTVDRSIVQGKMVSGAVAASAGYLAGDMGKWLESGTSVTEGYDIAGTKYPTLEKGQNTKLGIRSNNYDGDFSAAISSTCKNKELAARVLDYGYSEAGKLMFNFGIEGESYEMKDGKPVFKDEILNAAGGDSLSAYSWMTSGGPSILMPEMYSQRLKFEQQRDAMKKWGENDMKKHKIPNYTYTDEETEIDSQYSTTIKTHTDEMLYKFIMGKRSLDEFDTFVSELNQMGLDKVLQVKQAAVDRYNKR